MVGAEREEAARRRVEAEFAPADRAEALALVRDLLARNLAESASVWDEVLDLAAGDLDDLRDAIRLAQSDWRDLKMAAASRAVLRSLLGMSGPAQRILGPDAVAGIERAYARHRPVVERHFPAAQVAEVMLLMGPSWPEPAEEILRLARGDAARLRALLRGRPAGEADPAIPPPLAELPLGVAELIRRDFAPGEWQEAARAAEGVPYGPAHGGLLVWLLIAEYAGGDLALLRDGARLARTDEDALARGVAARRQRERDAG